MILPKISVITPPYNQAQYLEKTILSLLHNYELLEFILVGASCTGGPDTCSKKLGKEMQADPEPVVRKMDSDINR